jgi:large subunit ribosomal protein L15
MFSLSNLPKTVGKTSRRIGRGIGSGKGKNAGHGHKGQIKRSGGRKAPVGFEGGQASLIKRIPKYRGYNNNGKLNRDLYVLNTGVLDKFFESGDLVNVETLFAKGLLTDKIERVRIVLKGETKKTFKFGEEVYLTKGVKALFETK